MLRGSLESILVVGRLWEGCVKTLSFSTYSFYLLQRVFINTWFSNMVFRVVHTGFSTAILVTSRLLTPLFYKLSTPPTTIATILKPNLITSSYRRCSL
jgi:hypothetical protein